MDVQRVLGILMYPRIHSGSCAPAATGSHPLATFFEGFT